MGLAGLYKNFLRYLNTININDRFCCLAQDVVTRHRVELVGTRGPDLANSLDHTFVII
jgi:hypothetical protein